MPCWALATLEAAMIYSGKRAVVLGPGHSGEARGNPLCEEGAEVTICESCDNPGLRDKSSRLKAQGIEVDPGSPRPIPTRPPMMSASSVQASIRPFPLAQNVLRKKILVIGELELAFEECICPVVAITGTNGKTTTTELTTAMLQGSGVRTMASGNIGLPFATAVRQSNELDVMVLEVSSFQLETIDTFRPHVSVWLNLSPNHLDRYRDMDEYRRAKLRIFMNQTSEDYAVVNVRESLPPIAARTITFSAYDPEADFSPCATASFTTGMSQCLIKRKTRLSGIHNAENLMAALGVGLALGVDFEKMAAAVGEYTAPVHRCEFVRDLEGVRWINDSKATNLDSVEKAILSQSRPIVLIAGERTKDSSSIPIAPLVRERARRRPHRRNEGAHRTVPGAAWIVGFPASLEEAVEVARVEPQTTATPCSFHPERRPSTCSAITASAATALRTP